MKTAIVILNWNGSQLLQRFLPLVIEHSFGCELVVADNASTDDSIAMLHKNFPEIRIIENPINNGYAGGYNFALGKIDADIFVLLNSDIEVTAHWIEPVLDLFKKDELIAAAQPKIKAFDQRSYFEYAGASGGFIDRFGYPFCRGRIFENLEEDLRQYDDVREVFWASGACLFVRAKVFQDVGGFDESFFAHMEEIDLCWRMKNQGYKIYVQPQSTVYHIGGGTLSKSNWKKTYLNFRNNLELLYKNLEDQYLFRSIFFRMILDSVAAFKFLISNGPSHFLAILKAHFSFYKMLPSIRKKRRDLKKLIQNRNNTGAFPGSIVMQYFIYGKMTFDAIWDKEKSTTD